MNKIKPIILALFLFVLTSFTMNKLPKIFTDLLERANLTFEPPKGLMEIKTIDNEQMNYEYCLNPPNDWTKYSKHFVNKISLTKFGNYENKTNIYS